MVRSFIDQAKTMFSAAVSKYQGRAAVAALGAIAAGFAVAAVAVLLIDAVGPVIGCLVLAGAFALAALTASAYAAANERRQEQALRDITANKSAAVMASIAAAAPLALAQGAGVLARRAPLVVLLILGGLFLQNFANRPPPRR